MIIPDITISNWNSIALLIDFVWDRPAIPLREVAKVKKNLFALFLLSITFSIELMISLYCSNKWSSYFSPYEVLEFEINVTDSFDILN